MKIGIITQPLRDSSGGILQNFALQTVLKKLGNEPITLDWHKVENPSIKSYVAFFVFSFLNLFGRNHPVPSVVRPSQWEKMRINPQQFVNKYINRTEIIDDKEELILKCQQLGLKGYIVGSDQVWRPEYNRDKMKPFLNFTEGMDVKRVAYAASFGVDDWRYSPEQTKEASKLLKLFDGISVREKSGIDLCKNNLNVNAIQVLDPTLLLDNGDYEKLVYQENEQESTGDMLTFILDRNKKTDAVINEIASILNLRPFNVSRPEKLPPFTTNRQLHRYTYPRVTQWLRGFMDAKFVVCDSFHGAVFSIIFNKPFIVLSNSNRGNARFDSLLSMFSLEKRMSTGNDLSIINQPIDWDQVNNIREILRKKSIDFLIEKLK